MKDELLYKKDGNFLCEEDRAVIDAFNKKYQARPEYRIQTHLLPEPFIGNPHTAKLLMLALNPGYSGNDKNELDSEDDLHQTPVFKKLIEDNLACKEVAYPFYYLNESSAFQNSPGHKFWRKRILRQLIEEQNISITHLAKSICCVQYHAYHSTQYKSLGKNSIKSQEDTKKIIQNFIEKNRKNNFLPIIIMRSQSLWMKRIPELKNIEEEGIVLRNPRNPVISRNNMKEGLYEKLVGILEV